MMPVAEIILKSFLCEKAGISERIKDRVPHLRHRKRLARLQALAKPVGRFNESCISLSDAFMRLTTDDSAAMTQIKARCPIAHSQ